ncbi:unnamed protein product [Alopecurus aequalis]
MARATAIFFICLLVASQARARVRNKDDGSSSGSPYVDPKWPIMFFTIIAVHLGNTNSCVSGYTDAGEGFKICIPSWVAIADDGGFLVGEAAKKHGAADPQAAAFGFKRLLGRRFTGFDHEVIQRLADRVPYKIVESGAGGVNIELRSTATGRANRLDVSTAAALVVARLKASAETYLGLKVHDAVVTVPDYFYEGQRDAAMDAAAEFAGLTTARIIDEPTAAAVSHGIHKWLRNEGSLLVLHVGGGTTDASVLCYNDGVFQGCGCKRDLHLGGDDFDQRITDHFVELIQQKHDLDIRNDRIALGKLRTECERAKKELSSRDVAHVRVPDTGLAEPLTRATLEELNHDLFEKIVALVDKVEVRGNKLSENKDLIDEVLLVGGSARIPMIQRLISNYFEAKKPVTAVEPDDSFVYGGPLLVQPYGDAYECMGVAGRRQWHVSDVCHPRNFRPRLSLTKPLSVHSV